MVFKCILIFGIVLFIVIAFFLFKKKYSLKIRFLEGKLKFIVNKKATHKNNKIIVTENGKQKLVKQIKGLEIHFYGDNNTLICPKSCKFSDCVIHFSGSNTDFEFGEDCFIVQMKAIVSGGGSGNKIYIGRGFVNSGILQIFAGGGPNNNLHIGDGSMAARDVAIYTNDGHDIFDKNTSVVFNQAKRDLVIGDHVWICHGCIILKNTQIANNNIVGSGSVVSGKFNDEYTIIAGNPAEVIKRDVDWHW